VLSDGLGNIMKELQVSGHGRVAQSWVGTGPNDEIAPKDLANALGSDTLADDGEWAKFERVLIHLMSSRPGRIVVERKIDIPRPRDLDVAFTQGFQDIVHELRSHIVKGRQ